MKPLAITPIPVRPLTAPKATAAVWRPDPARHGAGNCHACRGSGEALGGGILFCDRCGGTGTFGPGPQRVIGPDGVRVTLYGPVPAWIQSALKP